jgi:hypothetical protein
VSGAQHDEVEDAGGDDRDLQDDGASQPPLDRRPDQYRIACAQGISQEAVVERVLGAGSQ